MVPYLLSESLFKLRSMYSFRMIVIELARMQFYKILPILSITSFVDLQFYEMQDLK